jgi:flagellar protein FlaG
MRIDALSFGGSQSDYGAQIGNRHIIQAVRAVNASGKLGEASELTFLLDETTRRLVVRVVDRTTGEVLQQIPNEQILRLAQDFKASGR